MAEYTQNNNGNVEYFNSDGTKKKNKKNKKKWVFNVIQKKV